ncbi:MAG: hypothetical protein B7Z60_06480 [Ferrovum sp. 37-45-19]|jgi:hypothetical protein|nr:MAG: hypothetical protein B7Z65_04430 [Ferrovum sp. 21-44-67]OYV94090.1 MAG: hypothetical protein B7Z60_06480 [Ferrovum sp. 37-45-19]OZB33980.1 MAG: hypothetical protein B7X47_02430 [Ferrovum sp. 34-44-207]HQT82088.1 DUF6502 family protein [Ferrovaceae bacterium]HQU05838.1 DUF6502 family protein [Ferrovaceae bacterium]
MVSKKIKLDPQLVLKQTLIIMQPLILWLLRSGVRHPEFSVAIKQVFLEQASQELTRLGVKQTDSALSLLSGLHRKDVRSLIPVLQQLVESGGDRPRELLGKPTLPSQIMTRWLASGWQDILPLTGDNRSFEKLVRQVSSDVHPRSVVNELERLGMIEVDEQQVRLIRDAFVPDPSMVEAGNLLAGSTADHLAAGVHNLSDMNDHKFLEQSVFADGLTEQSIIELENLAKALWLQVMSSLIEAAVPLSDKDEPNGGDQRIRIGMFCYSEPIHSNSNTLPKKNKNNNNEMISNKNNKSSDPQSVAKRNETS